MIRRALLVLLAALPLYAKSLHWRSIDVKARLDADGKLHVVERQQMVFDGDWNGGERDFGLRPGQHVQVHRISRMDAGGREITLEQGDLAQVDRWDYASSGVVRWRSRLPDDPPFANHELTYVLDYTYSDILTPEEAGFRLSHDFGLPNRSGVIERFTISLDFDPAWSGQNLRKTYAPLEPGQGVPVNRTLTYGGEGWPADVARPLPWWVGPSAVAFFALGAWLLIRAFIRSEREIGRFAPLPVQFDPRLLTLNPELAGAVWDTGVGPAEVAALLARMAQEGKITTRAEGEVLQLELNVPLESLDGYEQRLAQKLFITNETDTKQIREHYKRTGFNPAAIIRPGIMAAVAQTIPGWTMKERRFEPRRHVAILGAAMLLLMGSALFNDEPGVFMAAAFNGTIFGLLACVTAYFKSRAITDFRAAFAGPGFLIGIPIASFTVGALHAAGSRTGTALLFAIAVWLLALLHLVLDMLKIRDPRDVVDFRRRVAGARKFFMEQLKLPTPALRDEWFPYILAFGLSQHVDQWFRAFGGSPAASGGGSSTWSSSSSFSSSSAWTGGGGAFGGAGATSSWALAAGAMAAGVAAPSSRGGGGGGGGGGGSSSGGGGGGGW